jgi:predicted protein tyrosine phosphatase
LKAFDSNNVERCERALGMFSKYDELKSDSDAVHAKRNTPRTEE